MPTTEHQTCMRLRLEHTGGSTDKRNKLLSQDPPPPRMDTLWRHPLGCTHAPKLRRPPPSLCGSTHIPLPMLTPSTQQQLPVCSTTTSQKRSTSSEPRHAQRMPKLGSQQASKQARAMQKASRCLASHRRPKGKNELAAGHACRVSRPCKAPCIQAVVHLRSGGIPTFGSTACHEERHGLLDS